MASPPSFRRRRLGRELRALREARELTIEEAAPRADISDATLSRIERAAVEIKVNAVKAILDVYEVTGEQREALLTLARDAKNQGWWHIYGDVLPAWFEVYMSLEAEAESLDVYDGFLINGLLQTEDYARALLTASRPSQTPQDIHRLVDLRMQRQSRVTRGELRLTTIVDECGLHRLYGDPKVMRAQIQRLIEMAELRNVLLQVLPTGSPPSTANGFSILQFTPEDPSVVYLENELGALYMEKPDQIRHYSRLYEHLRAAALSPEASLAHLARRLKE